MRLRIPPFVKNYFQDGNGLPQAWRIIWMLIWVAVTMLAIVSATTTFFSLRMTVFNVPPAGPDDGWSYGLYAFTMEWLAPFLISVSIAMMLVAFKAAMTRLGKWLPRWVYAVCMLMITVVASLSIIFNFDIIFGVSRSTYLMETQKAAAYDDFAPALTAARGAIKVKIEEIEHQAQEDIDSLAEDYQTDLATLRGAGTSSVEGVRTTAERVITSLQSDRDDDLAALETQYLAEKLAIQQERTATMDPLKDALAGWRFQQATRKAELQAIIENEREGREGEGLSGVAGRGPRTKSAEAELEEMQQQYAAQEGEFQRQIDEKRDEFATRLEEAKANYDSERERIRGEYETRIEEARTDAQAAISAAQGTSSTTTQANLAARESEYTAAVARIEEQKKADIGRYESLGDKAEEAEQALLDLQMCDELSCISDKGAALSGIMIPIATLTGTQIPKSTTLPPMFVSIELTVDCVRAMMPWNDEPAPPETVIVIFSWVVAIIIDLADGVALLMFSYILLAAQKRREEEENGSRRDDPEAEDAPPPVLAS